MIHNNFSQDVKLADLFNQFLQNSFYKKLKDDGFIQSYKSYSFANSVNEQFSGKDIQFVLPDGQVMIVDEKAAFDYVCKNLPTFAFELGALNKKGEFVPGWFIDNSKATTHYHLFWPKADMPLNKASDFSFLKKIYFLCISRERLTNYLLSQGVDLQKLEEFARTKVLDNNPVSEKIPLTEVFPQLENAPDGQRLLKNMHICVTGCRVKKEHPCNLVINRLFLEENFIESEFLHGGAVLQPSPTSCDTSKHVDWSYVSKKPDSSIFSMPLQVSKSVSFNAASMPAPASITNPSELSTKKNVRSLSKELCDFFYYRICPYLQKHKIIPSSLDPFTEISLNTNFLDKFSQGDLFTGYLFPLGHLVPSADNTDRFISASFLSGPSCVKYHLLFYISTTAASYSSLDHVSSIKMFLISNLDLQNYFESHDISFSMLHGKANEVIRNCNRVNKDNLTLSFDRLFPEIVDIGEIACRMYVDDNEVGLSFPKRFLLDHFRTYDFANGILLARHDADSWYLKTATKDDSFSTIWLSADHCTEELKI